MKAASLGLLLLGSLLGLVSFFVPRVEVPSFGGEVFSSWTWVRHMARGGDPEVAVYQALLAAAPALGCLLAGLPALFRRGTPALLRWLLAGFFLLWAFTISMMGSIAATSDEGGGLALLEFVVPLGLATVVLARLIGGGDPQGTARVLQASIAALYLLHAATALGNSQLVVHGGAAVPVVAGLLLLAGSLLSLARPEALPAAPAPGIPS